MEPPVSFDAASVRTEKVKVWRAIKPIAPENTVRGQYGPGEIEGDKQVLRLPPGRPRQSRTSQTETYAALKVEIENWRWAGVPIYIRAGKRMAKRRHRSHHPCSSSRRYASLQGL